MIYLDTHAVVWLHQGDLDWLTAKGRRAIDHDPDLRVSPMVALELQYLREIDRLRFSADEILSNLAVRIGARTCQIPFDVVVRHAMRVTWTRDPFDRVIAAHALAADAPLLTADEVMAKHYPRCVR